MKILLMFLFFIIGCNKELEIKNSWIKLDSSCLVQDNKVNYCVANIRNKNLIETESFLHYCLDHKVYSFEFINGNLLKIQTPICEEMYGKVK